MFINFEYFNKSFRKLTGFSKNNFSNVTLTYVVKNITHQGECCLKTHDMIVCINENHILFSNLI